MMALGLLTLDRMGKSRGLLAGLALNALTFLLLPHVAVSLAPALIGLTFLILTAEFSTVSVLSPLSEPVPEVRSTVLALNSAVVSGAVLLASLIAPRLWQAGGLTLETAFSAGRRCARPCCGGACPRNRLWPAEARRRAASESMTEVAEAHRCQWNALARPGAQRQPVGWRRRL